MQYEGESSHLTKESRIEDFFYFKTT